MKDVTEFIEKYLEEQYSIYFMLTFMKILMNLSYKRIKPRLNSVDLVKLDLIRLLFAVKLAKSLNEETLISNLDQSSISQNIKTNRSREIKRCQN